MLKVVFLPGMDGTGFLFKELLKEIPSEIDCEVICLNDIPGASYRQQAESIAEKIEMSRVVLVAESYSGRIAYDLCSILGSRVLKVVFIASFLSCPSRLAKLAARFPECLLRPTFLPGWFMNKFCFNGHGSDVLAESVCHAIAQVKPDVLKQRLINMAELTEPQQHKAVSVVYIQPTEDRLVGPQAVSVLGSVYQRLELEAVEGGHFIAQTAPKACAAIIRRAVTT